MLYVEIDGLTPCLIDNETGDIVETEVIRIKRKSFLEKFNKRTGWYVNWTDLLEENEIYALVVKGTVSIQGLVAVRIDDTMQSSFVTWMVAAPCNTPTKTTTKRYNGVGGHLFAIAAQRSREMGYNCAISGFAANHELMEHYCKILGAEPICMLHPYQIFVPEEAGKRIREVYTYEWTNETI